MTKRGASAALAVAVLAACAHPGGSAGEDAATEIILLDAAWARTMERGDGEGWRALVAEDALFAGRALLRGRDEVWSAWKAFFTEGGPTHRWTPLAGGMAASGD